MDLWPFVPSVRSEARVPSSWDGVIHGQLREALRTRGYPPDLEATVPVDVIAEAVASVARRLEVEHHHIRSIP